MKYLLVIFLLILLVAGGVAAWMWYGMTHSYQGFAKEGVFVDLPHDEERIAIFKVHLARRGVDPSQFNFQQIMQFTSGWTGAEIEQCVISALTRARLEDRKVTENDLVNASVGGIPLSRAMKEQINHIRQWAFQRAVRASPGPVAR